MRQIFFSLAFFLILGLGAAVAAQQTAPGPDVAKGKTLHDAGCLRCHDTSVYTRPGRKVASLQRLEGQVRTCAHAFGLKWNAQDLADVTAYLNQNFYHFTK